MEHEIYNFSLNNIQGSSVNFSSYKDKVLLLVNVASKCGLTPQYDGLEKLYKQYQDRGLMVLGFPANEFLAQEPGSNADIQEFCRMNYGVNFPMFEKIKVKGEGQHPLYQFLTKKKPIATMKPGGNLLERLESKGLLDGRPEDIKWNFEKFLVDKKGNVVERFSPELDPLDPIITKAIENLL